MIKYLVVFAIMLPSPAFADGDDWLKSIMTGDGPTVTIGEEPPVVDPGDDTDPPVADDPDEPGGEPGEPGVNVFYGYQTCGVTCPPSKAKPKPLITSSYRFAAPPHMPHPPHQQPQTYIQPVNYPQIGNTVFPHPADDDYVPSDPSEEPAQ